MSQLKKIRRKISRDNGKRYELNDPEPSFVVRYLGMKQVDADFRSSADYGAEGTQICRECVAELAEDKVVQKVSLLISTNISRGLTITDCLSKDEQAAFQLQNIAFCTADERWPAMFSFIGKARDGQLQCHVFDCEKEEKAAAVCTALSGAFLTAHDNWSRMKKRREERKSRDETITRKSSLADRNYYYNDE